MWTVLKWGFLVLACMALVGSVILVWQAEGEKQFLVDTTAAEQQRQAQVDKPLIIERKAGKMIWRLKARKAEQELRGSMHLIEPELELFSESGKRMPMTGREAWFEPISKMIRFKGDVVMRYGEWTLYGDDVSYDHATDTVNIPGTFRINGKMTRVRGRGLTAWRNEQRVRVEHGVWVEDRHPYKTQGMQE